MPNTKDIRHRIKSIGNTKKITKAMEMVASSKMRRAVNSVLATRPYSSLAWQLILNVAQKIKIQRHPLLRNRKEIKKMAVVLITSNRGLCGSFNQQVIKTAVEYIKQQKSLKENLEVELICLGKKGARAMSRSGQKVAAEFIKPDILKDSEEIRPIQKMILTDFLQKKYDQIALVYTDYVSALKQVPRVKQILPIKTIRDKFLGEIGDVIQENKKESFEYLFEPKPQIILDVLLPRLLEVQIYQAVLESNAAEHSARMLAMRNANEAAGDMISELTLAYNQLRQAAITREIAEIAGGKAALE
ncbi:MAG: ATP synthase F1 subunit gamma [Patescibacteria group bacterium]